LSETSLERGPTLPWVLGICGVVFSLNQLAVGPLSLRTHAWEVIAVVAGIYLIRNVDPAWLISAGLALSIFSDRWFLLHIGGPVGPDRMLIVVGLAATLLRIGPSHDRPPIELRAVHFALAAAFGYALISMILARTTDTHSSVFALLDQYGLFPFLVFTAAPTVFRTARQRRILLGSLVATGAYLAITALFEKLKLHSLIWPKYINNPFIGAHYGRSRGPFVEAVADGLAMYACAIASAIAFVTWRRPGARVLAAATCVMCLLGVQLTVTRAVWLGAMVATFVVLVAAEPLRRYLVPGVAASLCLIFGAFAVVPGLTSLARSRQRDKGPIYERRNSDAAGLRMVKAKPLFGFGWYRHNKASQPYFRNPKTFPFMGEKAGFHNIFLIFAVGLGLVGFGIWLLAALLAFGGGMRPRGPPELTPWRIGLIALVTCYVVAGMAGPLAYLYPTMLAWTWAGVAYGRRTPDLEPEPEPAPPPARAPRPAAIRRPRSTVPRWGGHDLKRLPGKAA
jgi:O-antigen ligase